MKAVNLLPERHRPKRATGGRQGSSYVVLGALAAVVLAVFAYVMTVNSINSSKSDIASAKAETTAANARAEALGAYGTFANVKTQRVTAVKQIADGRYDWERLVRELGHVLPQGVWIDQASATDGAASSGASAAASSDSSGAPSLKLEGCARDQRTVATTLVRLREIQGAQDVQLTQSAKPDASGGTSSSSSSTGSGDCGLTHGRPNYSFEVTVALAGADQQASTKVAPASLGGGQ